MILDVNPTVDYAFKHMVGRESTRPILIHMIDCVLDPAPGHHIRDVDLLNPFNPKESLDDKLSILDVKARDQAGRQFNIEMQMLAYRYYEKRILYYGARLHQQQLHEGEDYLQLKPTISISFLNHVMFPDKPEYHLRFQLLETSLSFPLTKDIEFHILELPKFKKSLAELRTGLDFWLYFLRNAEKMEEVEFLAAMQHQPALLRAWEELKVLKQTDAERERYEARRKAQLDYNTGLKVARMEGEEIGLERGEKIGLERGERIGLERGERIGLERGEKIGAIHLCQRLLNRPETPHDQLLKLSLAELGRLAEDLRNDVARN